MKTKQTREQLLKSLVAASNKLVDQNASVSNWCPERRVVLDLLNLIEVAPRALNKTNKGKWTRGKITVQLTVREIAELIRLWHEQPRRIASKRVLNKLNKASDRYFAYPYHQ